MQGREMLLFFKFYIMKYTAHVVGREKKPNKTTTKKTLSCARKQLLFRNRYQKVSQWCLWDIWDTDIAFIYVKESRSKIRNSLWISDIAESEETHTNDLSLSLSPLICVREREREKERERQRERKRRSERGDLEEELICGTTVDSTKNGIGEKVSNSRCECMGSLRL